jgi:hypothetical protein
MLSLLTLTSTYNGQDLLHGTSGSDTVLTIAVWASVLRVWLLLSSFDCCCC